MRIWSRETGSAVPSCACLLISILRLNLVLTYGIPHEFRGGVHLFIWTAIRHRAVSARLFSIRRSVLSGIPILDDILRELHVRLRHSLCQEALPREGEKLLLGKPLLSFRCRPLTLADNTDGSGSYRLNLYLTPGLSFGTTTTPSIGAGYLAHQLIFEQRIGYAADFMQIVRTYRT